MFKFKVVPDTGSEFEVDGKMRDILAWEASNKANSFSNLVDGMRISDLYEIAYHASVRTGAFTGTVAEFKTTVDVIPDMEEQDPTNADA